MLEQDFDFLRTTMAVPVIFAFGPAPRAAMQTFAVPTTNAYYEHPCVVYPTCGNNRLVYDMQHVCHPGAANQGGYHTDFTHSGGFQRSPTFDAGRAGFQNHGDGFFYQTSKTPKRRKNPMALVSASPVFNEPEDKHVTVVLSNLPRLLCSENGFEAALEGTLIKDAVRLFAVERTKKGIEAVVILKTETAAQTLMKHFRSMSCGRFGAVTARYCDDRGKKLMASKAPKEDMAETKSDELVSPAETSSNEDKSETRSDELASLAESSSNSKGTCAESKTNITLPLVLTQTSLKMRWADYEDDRDSDYEDDAQSTNAGVFPSSSESAESINFD
jgi:hypothetical protein